MDNVVPLKTAAPPTERTGLGNHLTRLSVGGAGMILGQGPHAVPGIMDCGQGPSFVLPGNRMRFAR